MNRLRPPRALLGSWLALLALLGLTLVLSYQPLGAFNGPIALGIASVKALVVAVVFMELRERRPLTIVIASAGFFWLAVLLWLAAIDFMTRPQFPPSISPIPAELSIP